MNVLCPVDFSYTSINALKWAVEFLNNYPFSKIELIHCVHSYKGGNFYIDVDDILYEKAQESMNNLLESLIAENLSVAFESKVVKVDPKSYLIDYANSADIELIILGTSGLSDIKDITIGSVTEYITRKSKIPLIAVPEGVKFRGLEKVVLALGNELKASDQLELFNSITQKFDSEIHLVQVYEAKDEKTIDPVILENYALKPHVTESLEMDESISNTFSKYAENQDAELICLVHLHRKWLEEIFHRSIVKEELFEIDKPLLILHGR